MEAFCANFWHTSFLGVLRGCWIQICCMPSWKIATNASKSRNPRWPPPWDANLSISISFFTKHDINLNKTWFSMFSDMRNPLPYSVWWWNMCESKMSTIVGVKCINIHMLLTKHGRNINGTRFSMSSDMGNPFKYSVWWWNVGKSKIAAIAGIATF